MNKILLALAILVFIISGATIVKLNLHNGKVWDKTELGVSNPAAVYCLEMGYRYKVENTPQGQVGICVFPDQTECDEWAFFRGECGQKWIKLHYEVGNCSELTRGSQNYYTYDPRANTIIAYVTVNCGSDEVKVERGEKYRIIEKDYDGKLLRCVCQKEVKIFNATDLEVEFLSLSGEAVKLEKKTEKETEFCGWSTYGKCKSDKDCTIDGCSGQVCRSVFEDPIFTTCEWRDCYDHSQMRCACINNACQWIKI
ncbi:MAG: DUF333 domain-containing protein [Archaeoglobaceae archaeon]|nr:DUF333 domain-containing protein [Archaeoglobaceae archaeon]MDW8128195.1 DUF333 domain-containing protein [Archaeoglobaceae archaeon]